MIIHHGDHQSLRIRRADLPECPLIPNPRGKPLDFRCSAIAIYVISTVRRLIEFTAWPKTVKCSEMYCRYQAMLVYLAKYSEM